MSLYDDALEALRDAGLNEGRDVLFGREHQPTVWERELRERGFGVEADIVAHVVSPPPKPPPAEPAIPAGYPVREGCAPLRSQEEWEKLDQKERLARMDEVDWLLANDWPDAPDAPAAQAPAAAAAQLPPDIRPIEELEAYERLPTPRSGAEQREREAQFARLEPSFEFHLSQGR